MSKICFVLSTPDLSTNPLTEWLASVLKWPIQPSQPLYTQEYTVYEGGCLNKNPINALHHKLLNELQKSWYEHLGSASSLIERAKYEDELQSITTKSLDINCLFHSPLLCHFLPLYLPPLAPPGSTNPQATESPKILLHYSDPLSCAINLQNSWRMPLSAGLALWESYIIQACRNIKDQDYRLISSRHTSKCNESELRDLISFVSGKVGEDSAPIRLAGVENLKIQLPATKAQHLECIQSSQIEIAELLQQGDVNSIAARELCYSSTDTLEYYGQIRGALEASNVARDSYKSMYVTEMNKDEKANNNTKSGMETENSGENQNAGEQIVDSSLCNVKVQIKGMDTLEFLSTVNSPVLEMLRANLSNNNDELIYLNYGVTGEETLYFMSSNLLSLETEAA